MSSSLSPEHPDVPAQSSSFVSEDLGASNDGLESVIEGPQERADEGSSKDTIGSLQREDRPTKVDEDSPSEGSVLESNETDELEREEEAVRSKVRESEGEVPLNEEKAQVESVEQVLDEANDEGLNSKDSEYATPPSPSQSTTPRIPYSGSTLLAPSSIVEKLEATAEALSNRPQVDTAVTPHSNELVCSPTHTENAAPRSPSVPSPIFSNLFQNWTASEPQSMRSTDLSILPLGLGDPQLSSSRSQAPPVEVLSSDGESSDGSDFGNVAGKLSHRSSGSNSRASDGARSSCPDHEERGSSGRRSARSRTVTPTSIASSGSPRDLEEVAGNLSPIKLTPVQLVAQLQEMLRSDPIFYYTLKGVLLDHVENKGIKRVGRDEHVISKTLRMESTEIGKREAKNSQNVSGSKAKSQDQLGDNMTDVQTDLEEEEQDLPRTMVQISPASDSPGISREYTRTIIHRPTPSRIPHRHKYQPSATIHPATAKGDLGISRQRPVTTQSPLDNAFIPRSESFLAREAARAAEIASRIDPQKPHRRHSLAIHSNVPKVIVTPSLPEPQAVQYTSAYPRSFKSNSRVDGGRVRGDVNGVNPKHFQKFVPQPDRSNTLPYRRGASIASVDGMSNIRGRDALPSLWPVSGRAHFDFDDFPSNP